MTLSKRPRPSAGRRNTRPHRLAAMLAVVAALTALWADPAASASVRHHHSRPRAHASAHPSPPSHPGWVKYYVVQPPKNGYKEFLYEIAAKTVRNGDLDTAIFNLNKGRLQPDGGRLENPTVIDPGWILELPPNASGPGVHYGPLPVVIAAPAAPALAAPRHKFLAVATAHQSRPGTPYAMIAGGAVLIAFLLAAGLATIIKRRRKAGAAGKPGPGPVPPAPGPPAEMPAASPPGQLAGPGVSPAVWPQTCATPAVAADASDLSWPDYLTPALLRQAGPASLASAAALAQLPKTAPPAGPAQEYEVASGDDMIRVVLAAAPVAGREGKPGNGHTWLASTPYLAWTPLPYDMPDDGIAFACLGAGERGCLFIDLAAAPGPVAIDGDGPAAVRLAESIAHQLGTAPASGQHCQVIVIGDALPLPYGAIPVPSLPELGSILTPQEPGTAPEIVFCRLRSNQDTLMLERYASGSGRRVVLVVLGGLPDAPWSFTARPARRPAETPAPRPNGFRPGLAAEVHH